MGLHFLDVTLPTPAENLALDEALLEWCESGGSKGGVLRVWEPTQRFVVVGYANRVATEVNVDRCRERGVPIFRRCSGGGAVVQMPGCLNYALILRGDGPLAGVSEANCAIMKRNAAALASVTGRQVEVEGYTDLAINHRKVSGNSQRRKREWLLFHGSFLIDADLDLIDRLLRAPSKEPPYRKERRHSEFLTNLAIEPQALKRTLREAWNAMDSLNSIPHNLISKLVKEKYSSDAWNYKW